jgi:hypothetical protein
LEEVRCFARYAASFDERTENTANLACLGQKLPGGEQVPVQEASGVTAKFGWKSDFMHQGLVA